MGLRRQNRLTAKEVALLFSRGTVLHTSHLTLRFLVTTNASSGAAVIVPARVAAGAQQRNRLRRRVVSIVRSHQAQSKSGYIFAVVVKRPELPITEILEQEVLTLLKKSGILNR